MDAQGWISIALLASFQRVKARTLDPQLVRDVLTLSSLVEVREDWVRMHRWRNYVLPDAPPSLLDADGTLPYPPAPPGQLIADSGVVFYPEAEAGVGVGVGVAVLRQARPPPRRRSGRAGRGRR